MRIIITLILLVSLLPAKSDSISKGCHLWDSHAYGDVQTQPDWSQSHVGFPSDTKKGFWIKSEFIWSGTSGQKFIYVCDNCEQQAIYLTDSIHTQQQIFKDGPTSPGLDIFQIAEANLVQGRSYTLTAWVKPVYDPKQCFSIFDPERKAKELGVHITLSSIYIGLILAMIIVNFTLILPFGQLKYLYFVLFSLFYFLGVANLTLTPAWIFPQLSNLITHTDVLFCVAFYFAIRFSLVYLSTQELFPKAYRLGVYLSYSFLILGLLQFFDLVPVFLEFKNPQYVIGIFVLWLLAIGHRFFSPKPPPLYLIFAIGAYLMGIAAYVGFTDFALFDWLDGFESVPPYLGHFLENLIFTLYIARQVGVFHRRNQVSFEEHVSFHQNLLRNIAHELRTPLVGLHGIAEEHDSLVARKILDFKAFIDKLMKAKKP